MRSKFACLCFFNAKRLLCQNPEKSSFSFSLLSLSLSSSVFVPNFLLNQLFRSPPLRERFFLLPLRRFFRGFENLVADLDFMLCITYIDIFDSVRRETPQVSDESSRLARSLSYRSYCVTGHLSHVTGCTRAILLRVWSLFHLLGVSVTGFSRPYGVVWGAGHS